MPAKAKKSVVRDTPFSTMSVAEREAFYRSVDREFTKVETRPLTAADRREIAAARGRPAAPVGGAAGRVTPRPAVKSVSVQIESALLAEADRYAKAHGLKRTELVAAGLRLAMAAGTAADHA